MLDVRTHPPMAKMTRVSQGMAPSVSLHLVAAETVNETCYKLTVREHRASPNFLNATGTSIVAGFINVKNKTFDPYCWYGCSFGSQS